MKRGKKIKKGGKNKEGGKSGKHCQKQWYLKKINQKIDLHFVTYSLLITLSQHFLFLDPTFKSCSALNIIIETLSLWYLFGT